MQPKYLEILDELPRTTGGKIDRKALPAPTSAFLIQERPFSAPENDLEARIAGVWKTQLNIGPVSVDDDFFRAEHGFAYDEQSEDAPATTESTFM